jgi:hypothetical protein
LDRQFIASPRREARRRSVVRAVWFIYALMLIEGPLRKWFLPGLATPLTFLRDPFVAALYAYCFSFRLVASTTLAQAWLGMAALTSVLGLFQYGFAPVNPAGWLLGVRTYWLYMPLAFIVAKTFRREDVERLLLANVLLCVPYAMLVAAQYGAGPGAWINRGVGGDEEAAVGLGALIVRPFGLFTYTAPNVQFTAASVAMFLALYVSETRVRFRPLVLGCGALAIATMGVLTGSREIYFLVAVVVALTLGGAIVARPTARTLAMTATVLIGLALSAALFVFVFPDMFNAMIQRFEDAARSEGSIEGRALGPFTDLGYTMLSAPVHGYGLGIGAPGVSAFLGLPPLVYGESDLMRNVNELGLVVGSAMIALRWASAVFVAMLGVRAARLGALAVLPLAGFVATPLGVSQLTNSPLNAFLPWLIFGFVLAYARTPHWAEQN